MMQLVIIAVWKFSVAIFDLNCSNKYSPQPVRGQTESVPWNTNAIKIVNKAEKKDAEKNCFCDGSANQGSYASTTVLTLGIALSDQVFCAELFLIQIFLFNEKIHG